MTHAQFTQAIMSIMAKYRQLVETELAQATARGSNCLSEVLAAVERRWGHG